MSKEIERKKYFNQLKKKIRLEANIKDCFHPNKTECKMPIKNAHSLQRNGSLRFLEKDKNGNKYLYIHTERCYNSEYDFFDLKETGRRRATTFHGFCDYHDTQLFKALENEPEITDINNNEHCFLHSYKSFAISAHRKNQDWKLYNSTNTEIIELLNKTYTESQLNALKKGVLAAQNDFKIPKQKIDKWLLDKDYSQLEYLAFEYSYTIPVGCAAYITPHQMPSGRSIQTNPNEEIQSSIFTTVLPFSKRSVVILAAFPDDKLGCELLDEIDSIKYEIKQQKFLSFFLFEGAENIVVSPHYIDKKPIEWRKQYCELINHIADNTTPFLKYNVKTFPINYFAPSNAINLSS